MTRAMADLSDDEIVDLIAARGLNGIAYEEIHATALGLADNEDANEAIGVALARLRRLGRIYEDGSGDYTALSAAEWSRRLRYSLSPAEWGSLIAARLGCPERAAEIAAVLKGEP